MSSRLLARRIVAWTLIAALVPWPVHARTAPTQAAPGGAGRPQLYLVFQVGMTVPPSQPLLIAPPNLAWLEKFLAELANEENAPAESILDEIDATDAHVRSLPTAQALAGMPDTTPFTGSGPLDLTELLKVERAVRIAVENAGLDTREAELTIDQNQTVTLTASYKDGDIIVRGRVVDGQIVLTKEFAPLNAAGDDVGPAMRIRSSAPPASATSPRQTTTPETSPPPAPAVNERTAAAHTSAPAAGLPAGARPIPDELVREWGRAFYDRYAQQIGQITGNRNAQGRLLGVNGQPVSDHVLVGLRATQEAVVRDLSGFVADLKGKLEAPRDAKIALAQELQEKAAAVQQAHQQLQQALAVFQKQAETVLRLRKISLQSAEAFDAERHATLNQARAAYVQTLNATPLLGIKHDGVMLWEALTDRRRFPALQAGADRAAQIAAGQRYVELLNPYLRTAIAQAETQAAEVKGMNALDQLAQFASPAYAGVHERIALMGNPIGSTIPADVMGELQAAANDVFKSWTAEAWSRIIDKGVIVVGVGSIFLPLGPLLALAASGVQIVRSGRNVYVTYGQAAAAEGRVGVTGYEALFDAQGALTMAQGELFFDVAFGALDVFAAMKYAQAVRLERAARAEQAAADAAAETLGKAIPRGSVAGSRPVQNADGVLNRIDNEVLGGRPRVFDAGGAGDAAFFREAGLAPQLTVEVGGQTFHLSRPFRGPGGRVGVVAFQEMADGKIIPRTFYLSGEHGVWRAATAGGGTLQKGPVKYLHPKTGAEITAEEAKALGQYDIKYVNESAADVAAELQGPLHRWTNERGILQLDPDVGRRAFLGHLEDGRALERTEYDAFVKRTDVEEPLVLSNPGSAPDFAAGPLDRWTFQHPYYGDAEGFLFRSVDGESLFVVVRDRNGRVFVPSVQDGSASLTPFGTRTTAIRTDLTTTPVQHFDGRKRMAGQQQGEFVPGTNSEYVDVGEGHRNALNDAFRNNLPARASTAAPPPAPVPPASVAPARARVPGNTAVSINPAYQLDEVAEAVMAAQQNGSSPLDYARDLRTAMLDSRVNPVHVAAALKDRLMASRAPKTVAVGDLGDPASPVHGVELSLKAHGVSSGTAFTIEAVNRGQHPVVLEGEGIVVEPVSGTVAPPAGPGSGSATPVSQPVEAFCLERLRPVASEGMQYRIAPPPVQAEHRGLVDVLHAARRVADLGRLRPDSEFTGYFDFVRQWAMWVRREKLKEKKFIEAFLNQTRINVQGSGATWTREMEKAVRQAAPGRWQDITQILEEANRPKGRNGAVVDGTQPARVAHRAMPRRRVAA